jgi:hypothetical protein
MSKYDYLKVAPHSKISTWWMNEVVKGLNELYGYLLAIEPSTWKHTKTTYSLNPTTETILYTVTGKGIATLISDGDGDGKYTIRVYIDESLNDEFSTNSPKNVAYSFTSKIELRLYNPAPHSETASSATLKLVSLAIKL